MKVSVSLTTILATTWMAKADFAVRCENKQNTSLELYGGYELYDTCDTDCNCYAFELLCLQRVDGAFLLNALSFEEAEACPSTECLCNYSPTAWATSAFINNDVPLPNPHFDLLPSISEAEALDDPIINAIIDEMDGITVRQSNIIAHSLNAVVYPDLPGFITNDLVPTISSQCSSPVVNCHAHYDLDWTARLEFNDIDCANAEADDPCFATTACICDNGYFKIAENMPERPESYQSWGDVVESVIETVEDAVDAGTVEIKETTVDEDALADQAQFFTGEVPEDFVSFVEPEDDEGESGDSGDQDD